MSVWVKGDLSIQCSVDIMRQAMIHIMPEWESHILVDSEGNIPIYDWVGKQDTSQGYHIVIPGRKNPNHSQAPGLKYNDIGLRQTEDGHWEVGVDESGMTVVHNLEDNIKAELMRRKAAIIAKMQGWAVVADENDESSARLVLDCPRNKEADIMKTQA